MNVIFGGGRDFLGASIEQNTKVQFKGGEKKINNVLLLTNAFKFDNYYESRCGNIMQSN